MAPTPEAKAERKAMETRLSVLQQQVVQSGLPVIIVFEGFTATGKGAAISSLILNFDPRGFDVYPIRPPEGYERRKPWMWRFFEKTPAKGRIAVFDRSWYSGMTQLDDNIKKPETWLPYLDDINIFERQMNDDGCLIIKFFLRISKKEQKKRLDKLWGSKDTRWRVSARDIEDMKNYDRVDAFYRKMLESTDCPNAKWHAIDAKRRGHVRDTVYKTVIAELEHALGRLERQKEAPEAEPPKTPFINVKFDLAPINRIEDIELTGQTDQSEYKRQLHELQDELRNLHNIVYRKKIPVILGFEGNDAAGKGGSIRRVAAALDPRGYTVNPIGAPTADERNHHHLWRFYNRLPKTGHVAIFDRTWYGRLLVERVERLTPAVRISQAYNEINEFEGMLYQWGAVVVKFWLAIDKDEQLQRFEARQDTPEKQWKITDEDWRNREKWDVYVQAIDDMLQYTNTGNVPWNIVESNCKMYARIKVLKTVIRAIKERI